MHNDEGKIIQCINVAEIPMNGCLSNFFMMLW